MDNRKRKFAFYHVDLSSLRYGRHYLVPPLGASWFNVPFCDEMELLTLFVLRALSTGVWSLPTREARRILMPMETSSRASVDKLIHKFIDYGLLNRSVGRTYATAKLLNHVYEILDEKILPGEIKCLVKYSENQFSPKKTEDYYDDGVCIMRNMFCKRHEALSMFIGLAPIWKIPTEHKKTIVHLFKQIDRDINQESV